MQRRTVHTLQRLALCAGLALGAWAACEGLTHDTARADDPTSETSDERPGGLLDVVGGVVDIVLPDPPADSTDEGDGGRGDDPPSEQPQDEEPDTPIRDVVEDVVDTITPDPPEPVEGDDGRPQHPVDTPPAPDPSTETPTTPVIETPSTEQPGVEQTTEQPAPVRPANSPFGGLGPTLWTGDLTADDVQIGPRTGGTVCDNRDERGGTGRGDRPGTSTRDRLTFPRGSAGPGLVPLGAPCQPGDVAGYDDRMPAAPPNPTSDQVLVEPAPVSRVWMLDCRCDAEYDRDSDELPPSRLTLWPPGPA